MQAALVTSFVVTAKHSLPSSASRFCRLVLGPCGLHTGILVLASPSWTVMRDLAGSRVYNTPAGLRATQPAGGAEPGHSCNVESQPSRPRPEGSIQNGFTAGVNNQHIAQAT